MLSHIKSRVEFDVYGPIEDEGYWTLCTTLAQALPANVQFEYRGVLDSSQVVATLQGYDAMLLPTKGENFGHVIIEALLASCPVIVSDQTPWNSLAERGAGWVASLDRPHEFVAAIEELATLSESAYRQKCKAARLYALNVVAYATAKESNRALFEFERSS